MKVVATRPILYRSRQYAPGDIIPDAEPEMIVKWKESGSVIVPGGEEKPPKGDGEKKPPKKPPRKKIKPRKNTKNAENKPAKEKSKSTDSGESNGNENGGDESGQRNE